MGLVEDTNIGRLILTKMLAFAEYERGMIIEKCASGRAIAKQNPNYKEVVAITVISKSRL